MRHRGLLDGPASFSSLRPLAPELRVKIDTAFSFKGVRFLLYPILMMGLLCHGNMDIVNADGEFWHVSYMDAFSHVDRDGLPGRVDTRLCLQSTYSHVFDEQVAIKIKNNI